MGLYAFPKHNFCAQKEKLKEPLEVCPFVCPYMSTSPFCFEISF